VTTTTATAGCTSWRQVGLAPDPLVREQKPGAVLVTLLDSSRLVLRRPRITGDSLVGDSEGEKRRIAVPIDSVKAVAIRQLNGTTTALTVIGGVGVVFTALCLGVAGVCFPED
jgi:hypothetical protein